MSLNEHGLTPPGAPAPHSGDRIEEAAREMIGAGCVCAGRQSMRPILQRLYDDGKKAGAEWAAKILDAEVVRHRAEQEETNSGLAADGLRTFPHTFCEDYGCTSLEEFAAKIRGTNAK